MNGPLGRGRRQVAWAMPSGLLLAAVVLGCSPAASPVPRAHVTGHATAGPTCPVETVPPDPNCAARPVPGAVMVVTTPAGAEVARTTTAADGSFAFDLPSGPYVLVPGDVQGLMGRPAPSPFSVAAGGALITLDVQYDTGIR